MLCEETLAELRLEWTFYPLRDSVPLACRLEHLRIDASAEPQRVSRIHDDSIAILTLEAGKPYREAPRGVSEFGANAWREVAYWPEGTREIYAYIYRDDYRHLAPRATVRVRDGDLPQRLAEEESRHYQAPALNEELAAALRRDYPDVASTLLEAPQSIEHPIDPRSIIERALAAASAPNNQQAPALLLAADTLSQEVASFLPKSTKADDRSLTRFAAAGLTFEANPYDPGLRSTHSLRKVVQERYPASRWADRAALARLNVCDNDTDRFRGVITEGTRFLSARPRTPYRLEFTYAIAQAYETWWSLSRAVNDEFVDAANYKNGAEGARQNAIRWYERVMDLSPGTDAAFVARRAAARLQLSIDTGQRTFSCPYP